jgi:hypothetical protein
MSRTNIKSRRGSDESKMKVPTKTFSRTYEFGRYRGPEFAKNAHRGYGIPRRESSSGVVSGYNDPSLEPTPYRCKMCE